MENMELQSFEEKRQRLLSIQSLEGRSREFYLMMEEANQSHHLSVRRQTLLFRDLRILMKDIRVFSRMTDSLLFALNNDKFEPVVWLRERMGLNVHELTFTDGKSLLHWLVEHACDEPHKSYTAGAASVIVYLLGTATQNYRDREGFTYFHGACQIGNVRQVRRFIDELRAKVDDNKYALSPLCIAVECRRVDTARCLLLDYGANPDSRALHGLARLRRCDCSAFCRPVDEAQQRSAVDAIVDAFAARGARLDAPNNRGQTPLEWAVSRLDYDLTRALLRHGASLDNLNENLSLSIEDYMKYELSYYPVALYVPEMIELLSRHGFRMNFNTRLKFLKFWTTARRYEMDDISTLVSREKDPYTWSVWAVRDLIRIAYRLDLHDAFEFFIGEEAVKRLEDEFVRLRQEVLLSPNYDVNHRAPLPDDIVDTLAGIWVTRNTTLLQICQMSYKQASPILTSQRDWSLPDLGDEPIARDVVKRHIANVLMRPQLELFATDSFMMDHCRLGLPYVPNRTVVECFDDEYLVRLCEDIITLCEQRNEATSFIRISFYIFVIILIIGIIFIYINN